MRTLAMLATLLVGLGYVVTTPAYAAPKPKVAQDLQCPSPCVSAAEVEADVATQAELDALQAALNTLQANLDALVDADTLADLSCFDGDVARFDGAWNCESSAPGTLVVRDSLGENVGPLFGTDSVLIQAEGRNFHVLLMDDDSGFKATGGIRLLFVDPDCEGDAYIDNPGQRFFPAEPAWVGNGLLYALDPDGVRAAIRLQSFLSNNNCTNGGFDRDDPHPLVVILDLDAAFTPPLMLGH